MANEYLGREGTSKLISLVKDSIKDKQPVKISFTVNSGDWSDDSVTVYNDNILANSKYVYILGLSGDSMEIYDGGSIWADDIVSNGEITLHTKPDVELDIDLTFELIRFETSEEDTQSYGAKVISKILGGGGSVEGFRPSSIKILTPPTTVQYYAGDTFIPDGMTVEITYENGAKLETTGYRWQPSGPLEYGTKNVTVIYSENGGTVSIEQPITVIREEVAVPYQASHLTYNKSVQQANFTGYDQSKMTIIDGSTDGTDANTYSVTFRFNSIRYEWADTHGTEDRQVNWIIDRFTIQNVPSADDLEYNEQRQYPQWKNYDPEQLQIGGDEYGTEIKTYTTTFTPIQPNYQWTGGDISTKSVQWKIYDPIVTVPVPYITGSYTYNGNSQKPVIANLDDEHVDVIGEQEGINAKTYTITFTLHERCEWATGGSEPKNVQWTIGKATPSVTAPIKAADMTYNGSSRSLLANNGSTNFGTLQYSVNNADWTASIPTAINYGSYAIRYRVLGDSNINDVAETSIGTVTINKAAGTLTTTPTSVTLDTDHLSVDVTVNTNSDGKITATSKDTSIATTSVNGKTVTVSAVEKQLLAGSIPVGDTVTIKENGIDVEFLVVHQGNPDPSLYDASCNGTWLLRRTLNENRPFNGSNVNDYEKSAINTWLNNDYINNLDSKLKGVIKQVKIPYRPGSGTGTNISSGSNGLSCKIFLLSGPEIHYTYSDLIAGEGSVLDYFASCATTGADSKRISSFDGLVYGWWLRSPDTGSATNTWYVMSNGSCGSYNCNSVIGTRPCFIIPQDFDLNSLKSSNSIGDMAVGDTVSLNVDGNPTDFIIVQQGNPNASMYDSSCDGTWLLMKDCYDRTAWDVSGNTNDYANSTINTYLNSNFINKFDDNIKGVIKDVKIPYRPGNGTSASISSGANGLSCKIFLLSGTEVGFVNKNLPANEGTKLTYFFDTAEDGRDNKRIAKYASSQSVAEQWLRSPYLSGALNVSEIYTDGSLLYDTIQYSFGIRPCIILPKDFNPNPPSYASGTTTVTISVAEGTNWTKPSDASVSVNAEFGPTGKMASEYSVGDSVFLNVGGVKTEFLVVNQGKPSNSTLYDDSCNGTWLLMKDCYEKRQWNSSNVNDYENSTINAYLNDEFINKFDANIQAQIKQVKIPYRKGSGYNTTVTSGSSGLSAKIFLLSGTEVGFINQYIPANEGAVLSYFNGCATNGADSKRIANLNNVAAGWWFRSPYCISNYNATYALYVRTVGDWSGSLCSSENYAIRPALVLPSTALFNPSTNEFVGVATTLTAQLQAEIYMSNHIIDTMSAIQEAQTKENNQQQANIDYLSMMTGIDLPNEEPEQSIFNEDGDSDE